MSTAARATGWFTSSYSNGGEQCVECRVAPGESVGVRDTKDRAAGALWISPRSWCAFLGAVRAGRLCA